MGVGKDGDWECGGCQNRNYAFRSFCNLCKQPRLVVDTKTPADSKWLPRIGDWICSGCSNNNYASREQCKKCGQPKEVAALPVIAIMPGASLPTHAHYFARANGGLGPNVNIGMPNNPGLQQSLSSGSNWAYGGPEHGLQPSSVWPSSVSSSNGYPGSINQNQLVMAPKGWRSGDWLCNCGFHNYSSRGECKKCNASISVGGPPSVANSAIPALGTKRLASDEFVNDWDSKRLHAGDNNFLTNGQQLPYQGYQQMMGCNNSQSSGMYGFQQSASGTSGVSSGGIPTAPNFHMNVQSQVALMPPLLGKGAKQWRDGDWMCSNCSNHNFASRLQCNRCNGQRDAATEPVSVA